MPAALYQRPKDKGHVIEISDAHNGRFDKSRLGYTLARCIEGGVIGGEN